MAVRDTLNKIENLVASASHLPLTGKALITEDELLQLIDEFRNELPQELGHAEEIIRDQENIIRSAQHEAEKIIKQAEKRAVQLVDENDVVLKAREKARIIEIQAQQKATSLLENSRIQAKQFQDGVNQYSNQVFDQLIINVANTANSINDIEIILKKAMQVLQQSKMAFNNQVYSNNQAQAQQPQQQTQPQQPQNYQQEQPQNPQS
jgi:vacuolar-type H+-ATPase subunit H